MHWHELQLTFSLNCYGIWFLAWYDICFVSVTKLAHSYDNLFQFFKRATKNKEIVIEKEEESQSTVFTEEDFARFEREYEFD